MGEISVRSNVVAAGLAAALVLMPVAGGYAPASAQDFSITNKVEVPGDWTRKLQAWWDVHSYYPPDALEKKQDGTVKLHLVIHPDGVVWNTDKVQGSGSKSIDDAALYAFHDAHLPPFPPGAPVPQAELTLTLRYVLGPWPSKIPFTVGTDPVRDTVVETMQSKSCTGTITALWSWAYPSFSVRAIFYHEPDGSSWVKFWYHGKGPISLPVQELGKSASWTTPDEQLAKLTLHTHYWIWPSDDKHIAGTTVDPYGTINLTCE